MPTRSEQQLSDAEEEFIGRCAESYNAVGKWFGQGIDLFLRHVGLHLFRILNDADAAREQSVELTKSYAEHHPWMHFDYEFMDGILPMLQLRHASDANGFASHLELILQAYNHTDISHINRELAQFYVDAGPRDMHPQLPGGANYCYYHGTHVHGKDPCIYELGPGFLVDARPIPATSDPEVVELVRQAIGKKPEP